jgi:hypothetical protein
VQPAYAPQLAAMLAGEGHLSDRNDLLPRPRALPGPDPAETGPARRRRSGSGGSERPRVTGPEPEVRSYGATSSRFPARPAMTDNTETPGPLAYRAYK